MKTKQPILKIILTVFCIALVLLISVFFVGRYGWKLMGFSACESARIESVEVTDGQVTIKGSCPDLFARGFLGYHAEEKDGKLYVGFKFSGLFGIFETGIFDITIPTEGSVQQVIVKTKSDEYPIWPEQEEVSDPNPSKVVDEWTAGENGIYVKLERQDVYAIEWYFEHTSGGVSNADGSALEAGDLIFLENNIFQTAAGLERQVPFMLTLKNAEGKTLVQKNLIYEPDAPQLILTVTQEGQLLANGQSVADISVIPDAYKQILEQYRTALADGWSGQQLVDAGMNYLIRDVACETVGYTIEDLDGDGVSELAIGTLSGDAFYGKLIFELYTLDDSGNALRLFSSWERNRYYYAGGIQFANLGSSGADDSFETTLKLENRELVDMTFTTDPADYVQMELTPIAEST